MRDPRTSPRNPFDRPRMAGGGSLAWPLWPMKKPERPEPRKKKLRKVEQAAPGGLVVQVYCYLPGVHRNVILNLDSTSTIDDALEALWRKYQSDLKGGFMYCPNMLRNPNMDDYLLLPALGSGHPDYLSPALKGHWTIKQQLPFPHILVLVESRRAQMVNEEMIARHDQEQKELFGLEELCRGVMEDLYLTRYSDTLRAVQELLEAMQQWKAYMQAKLAEELLELDEQVERVVLALNMEETAEREAIARAWHKDVCAQDLERIAQRCAADRDAIELNVRMKALMVVLQGLIGDWNEHTQTVEQQMHRCFLEKQLLYDLSLEAVGLGVKPPPPPPKVPPRVDPCYRLIVRCGFPNAPKALELTLEHETSGHSVLNAFWNHLLDLFGGLPPKDWPSRYRRDFTLAPVDDEDPVILSLPLKEQLDPPFECEVVEAMRLVQRWAKWEERARTLSRVKHELQQRLENCQARIVAAQAQEAATREAVQRWHAEGLEQILRQKLQTEQHMKWTALGHQHRLCHSSAQEEEQHRGLKRQQSRDAKSAQAQTRGSLQAQYEQLQQDQEDLFQMVSTVKLKLYNAHRFMVLPFRDTLEEDAIDKGLMTPLHYQYQGPEPLPVTHTIKDLIRRQERRTSPASSKFVPALRIH
mmetsp:Transcript_90297/g.151026  ORF Transcript_90297/g.151026 Transcript_90297/m.151026 type:complete len:641 (-) Transcript_90297:255-2177(-)